MAFAQDYVEVADRIAEWYAKYPEGRITTELIEMSESRAVMKAYVFRDFNPEPVGVGHSYLAIPGSTPFTKGSELENAETSAVGRALVMAGIPSKNVASANEIRSKTAGAGAARFPAPAPAPSSAPVKGTGADTQASGGVSLAASPPGACTHTDTSPLKLDGKAMPKGWVRCLKCNEGVKAA
jgi:hypothetical protein